jgi:hypothetical protein
MNFENQIELVVRDGATGEVKGSFEKHNAIADDFLCGDGRIFSFTGLSFGLPYCFLLPDGAAWNTFTWDRTNPWCPYATGINRTGDQTTGVDQYWKTKTYYAPFASGNATPKHKMFYQWTALPYNMTLRAFGLTGVGEPFYGQSIYGIADAAMTFVPQTLVILPSGISVQGLQPVGGVPSQTPDIVEISYYLSIVGVS